MAGVRRSRQDDNRGSTMPFGTITIASLFKERGNCNLKQLISLRTSILSITTDNIVYNPKNSLAFSVVAFATSTSV